MEYVNAGWYWNDGIADVFFDHTERREEAEIMNESTELELTFQEKLLLASADQENEEEDSGCIEDCEVCPYYQPEEGGCINPYFD